MKYKKLLRMLLLALMIGLACMLPVPITFKNKDNLPKDLIEHVEIKEEDEDEDCKELF